MKSFAKDLQIGDVICLPRMRQFNTAIVKQRCATAWGGTLTLFRPYGVSANFSYSGGVICYVGVEEFSIVADETEYEVLERTKLQ